MWLKRPKRSLSDFGFVSGSGLASDPAMQAMLAKNAQAEQAYNAAKKADARKQFKQGALTAAAVVAAPMALSGAGAAAGGQGAAGGGWGMGGVTAPTFAAPNLIGGSAAAGSTAAKVGLGTRLGRIFSSTGFETGANVGLGLLGMRQSNKANDKARQAALDTQTKQIELEQQRLAQEATNANLDRAERAALNAAIQKLEGQKFTLLQEQAVFAREQAMIDREQVSYQRGITEKNEGVKDRYRTSIAEPAQQRLARMVGL